MMHHLCYYAIICLPLLSAAVGLQLTEYEEPKFTPIDEESDINRVLEHILKVAETGKKGGAHLAAKIIEERIHSRQEFFNYAYHTLRRSAFSGLLPRCICKLTTCSLPRCFAMCTSEEVAPERLFDCTSCVGDCLPVFMRCLSGVDG